MDYDKIQFRHRVKLADGSYTVGEVDMDFVRKHYIFDELNLTNKSVLDVGCWDGYFSFEAEKKGASKVVSFDDPNCRWGGTHGYNFLHNHFDSSAEYVNGNVYRINEFFNEKSFDVVLCYGVIYHLSDPLLALQNLFKVCKTDIIFEGKFSDSPNTSINPYLELIQYKSLNDDFSNVYMPSVAYMKLIAKYNGFELKKMNESINCRLNMIFSRNSDTNVSYPNFVFPTK